MKQIFWAAVFFLGCAVNAASPLKDWRFVNGNLAKVPNLKTESTNSTTLRGYGTKEWLLCQTISSYNATPADKVEITFTVSGKGKGKVGIYGYVKGYSFCGANSVAFDATAKKVTRKVMLNVPNGSKIVRPTITVLPGSELTFDSFALKVVPQNIFYTWRYANSKLDKIPGSRVVNGMAVTLKSVHKNQVLFRPDNELSATANDKIEVKFTASGKGIVKVGFYGYSKGWTVCATCVKDFQAAAAQKTVNFVFNMPKGAKVVRPIIMVMPGSEVTFYEHSIKVLPKGKP